MVALAYNVVYIVTMDTEDYRADVPDYSWSATITPQVGEAIDITRELAVMYDAIVGSMDWGSGFLDREDVEALFRVASICGFDVGEYEVETENVRLVTALGTPLSQSCRLATVLTKDGPVRRYRIYPTNEGKGSRLQILRYNPANHPDPYEVTEEIHLSEKIPTMPGVAIVGTLPLP